MYDKTYLLKKKQFVIRINERIDIYAILQVFLQSTIKTLVCYEHQFNQRIQLMNNVEIVEINIKQLE
jgi:hypothetical protein